MTWGNVLPRVGCVLLGLAMLVGAQRPDISTAERVAELFVATVLICAAFWDWSRRE